MWPGEQQPDGRQNPQGPAPQQQNAFGPPSPQGPPPQGPPPQGGGPYGQQPYGYPQQPGYPQAPGTPPPSGYGQPQYGQPQQPYGYPQGYGQPQQPHSPWAPAPSPGNRRGLVIGVSAAVAVVLVAAGVTALLLNRGSGNTPVASGSSSPSAPASPAGSAPASADDGTGDLHGGGSATVQPVVPGWQAVPRGDRAVAFDVPKDWKLDPQSTDIGFNDAKGNPAVLMGGPAEESKYSCGGTARAAAGTKGGKNAKSLQAAAEAEAENWAYFAFTDLTKNPKPLPHLNKAVPFTNSHGIKGYAASATETGEPNTGKCASNGAAYAVAWPGADNQLTIWVMYTATGVPGEVPAQTIRTMEESIRQIH